MYDQVFDDYTAGRYDLAMLGFQSFIQAFPRRPRRRKRTVTSGMSLLQPEQVARGAQDAFLKVINDYPQAPVGADGVLQARADLRAAEPARPRAKKAYEAAVQKFPDANVTQLARQALERLNRRLTD